MENLELNDLGKALEKKGLFLQVEIPNKQKFFGEIKTISKEDFDKVIDIASELNLQIPENNQNNSVYFAQIQNVLDYSLLRDLKISEELKKFIIDSGLFKILDDYKILDSDYFTYEPTSAEFLRLQKFISVAGTGNDQGTTGYYFIIEGENKGQFFGHYRNRGDLRGHVFMTTPEEINKDLVDSEREWEDKIERESENVE